MAVPMMAFVHSSISLRFLQTEEPQRHRDHGETNARRAGFQRHSQRTLVSIQDQAVLREAGKTLDDLRNTINDYRDRGRNESALAEKAERIVHGEKQVKEHRRADRGTAGAFTPLFPPEAA
jgi:hypothetical protein